MVESVFADCLEMLWWFTWDNTFIYKIVLLIFWFLFVWLIFWLLFVWLIFWFLFVAIINYLQKPTDIINRKRPFSVWFPYTAIERLWCQLEELIRSGHMVDQCDKLKKLLHGTLLSHLKLVCLYCISTAIFKFKFNSVVSFYKPLDLVFKFQLKVDSDDAISAASSWGLSASKTGMLCTIKIQGLLHGAASNVYFQMFYICLGLSICGESDSRMHKEWSLLYALRRRKGEILDTQSSSKLYNWTNSSSPPGEMSVTYCHHKYTLLKFVSVKWGW